MAVVVPAPETAQTGVARPMTPPHLLDRVETMLRGRASAFADVAATSPAYIDVDVSAEVALSSDVTPARLEADIRAFLSPWAEDGADLEDEAEAGDIAAALVRFIRSRPYVEAVADVSATLGEVPAGQSWLVPVAGKVRLDILLPESFGA
jgi:hypothetical protein